MTNSSAKRIAVRNESAIHNLRLGTIIFYLLSFLLKFLFRRSSWPPTTRSMMIYVLGSLPAAFLTQYLKRIGTPRRDPLTGTLISSGEDLNQRGVTELCFDIIYVTWTCQIGSGMFGDWFWWLYTIIPLYGIFKLWTSFISPMWFGRSSSPVQADGGVKEPVSKRQEKLRKRNERENARVKVQTRKHE